MIIGSDWADVWGTGTWQLQPFPSWQWDPIYAGSGDVAEMGYIHTVATVEDNTLVAQFGYNNIISVVGE